MPRGGSTSSLQEWLGEKNAADTLTLSAPDNVTSEMGLALLDVADVIRPHPEVVTFLIEVEDDDFLDELPKLAGGQEARDAIQAYLDRYGMRCVGEIDITRPRWSERPSTLVPLILDNIRNFEPGARRRRFEHGRQAAELKERDVLERLRALPDGERKAEETKRMIDRVRTFIGYREYPKYAIVSRYFIYKQALLAEAERLVQAHALSEKEDAFYLTFSEFHDIARTKQGWMTSSYASARTHSGRIKPSRRPGCSRRRARSSPGRTDATMFQRVRWSDWRFRPGLSKGGPGSSSTWPRPISGRTTSWSRPSRTPAGRLRSSRSRAWSPRWEA